MCGKSGLTAFLLLFNTEVPFKFWDILKLYYIPFIFLLYFVYDLTKNIPKVDRFWKRLFQKTEFGFSNIIEGKVTHGDLEYYLLTLPFNSLQLEKIFKKLIETKQFTPKAQINLFHNEYFYRVDTFQLLRDYIINFEWIPSAICTFLRYNKNNLPLELLDIIFEKYGKYPSVLFALSYFHHYNKEESNIYSKMGYEFKYTKKLLTFIEILFIVVFLLYIINFIIIVPIIIPSHSPLNYLGMYLILISILFIITALISFYVRENHFIWAIKKHLKKYDNLEDNYIINEIVDDLKEAFKN